MLVETHIHKAQEFPAPILIERLRFDARDRWVQVPVHEAAAELAVQFSNLNYIHELLSAGHEIQTTQAQYRKVRE